MRQTIPALVELGRPDLAADCDCAACQRLHAAITESALARARVREAAVDVDRTHRLPSAGGGPRANAHHPADDDD